MCVCVQCAVSTASMLDYVPLRRSLAISLHSFTQLSDVCLMSAAPTAETATVQHSGTTDKEEKKKKTKQSIAIREWTEEEYRHAPFTSLSFRFLP